MAKKALFHQVTTKDGHGTHINIYPAQRGDDLRNILETQNTKVLNIKSVGWHTVSTFYSPGEYYFQIDTLDIRVDDTCIGFNYLENQFSPTVHKINEICLNR